MKSTVRHFKKGEYLIHQNELSRHMFIVKSGTVRIIRQDGAHVIFTREIGAGGIVGELSLIDSEARSASIIAIEKVEAVMVQPDEFDNLCRKLPPWLPALGKAIAFRTRSILSQLQRNPGSHLTQNIISMIIYASIHENNKLEFDNEDLSGRLSDILRIPGITVTDCLEKLAEKGLLSIKNGKITINDINELEKYRESQKESIAEEHNKIFKP